MLQAIMMHAGGNPFVRTVVGLMILTAWGLSCQPKHSEPDEPDGSPPARGTSEVAPPTVVDEPVIVTEPVAKEPADSDSGPSSRPGPGSDASLEIDGFKALGKNSQGREEYQHLRTGLVMVLVPGGSFAMGTDDRAAGYSVKNEIPRHEVRLDRFLIAKREVTQTTWTQIMGKNPSKYRGTSLPVQGVSWNLAKRFCERTGLKLPTEAQWEFACRAGTKTAYAGRGRADEMGWYEHNSEGQPQPPGRKRANAHGLHDMHGNVMEWCEDVYDPEFYGKDAETAENPVCQAGSEFRICRGGDFLNDVRMARSAHRGGDRPNKGYPNVGLRPAFYPIP